MEFVGKRKVAYTSNNGKSMRSAILESFSGIDRPELDFEQQISSLDFDSLNNLLSVGFMDGSCKIIDPDGTHAVLFSTEGNISMDMQEENRVDMSTTGIAGSTKLLPIEEPTLKMKEIILKTEQY